MTAHSITNSLWPPRRAWRSQMKCMWCPFSKILKTASFFESSATCETKFYCDFFAYPERVLRVTEKAEKILSLK